MNTYLWKYPFGLYGNYTAIYYSDVDTDQEGEWKLVEMFPVWSITSRQKIIFKTEQALQEFVDKSYEEYQVKNKQDYFFYLFADMNFLQALKTFIKYYINMEKH